MNTPRVFHIDNGSEYIPDPAVLTRGRVATVYRDPYTRSKPEGVAELVRCIRRDFETGLEHWQVRFIHTGETGVRRIRPAFVPG
jgi:hypothetical protein